jgi:hypothetical protein
MNAQGPAYVTTGVLTFLEATNVSAEKDSCLLGTNIPVMVRQIALCMYVIFFDFEFLNQYFSLYVYTFPFEPACNSPQLVCS